MSRSRCRAKLLDSVDNRIDLNVIKTAYFQVIKGRFKGSVGRMVGAKCDRRHPGKSEYDTYSALLIFEPNGRTYKLQASDYYGGDLLVHPATSDDELIRVDSTTNTTIPEIQDRYGEKVSIGSMLVVHTNYGLKIGTVKKITPGGTIRFKDFDSKNAEFTKAVFVPEIGSAGKNSDLLVLKKDIMNQMMIRKLSQ